MKKAILYFCTIFFLVNMLSAGMAISGASQETSDDKIIEVLNQLATTTTEKVDKPVDSILQGWETYLEDSTKHTNAEYHTVLNALTDEYHETIAKIGECTTAYQSEQKNSDSTWVNRLIEKLGKSYVTENKLAVKQCLFAISARNIATACRVAETEAIYIETQRNEAFHNYFGLFARYIETLPKKKQVLVDGRKKAAEKILQLMKRQPLRGLYGDSYLTAKLQLETAKNKSEPKLYQHFLREKALAKPFDVMQAVQLLDEQIQ